MSTVEVSWVVIVAAHHASDSGTTVEVSIATAAVLTMVLVPYRDYAFHFGWAKISSAVVYVIFMAVGGAAGWVGFKAGTAIGWHPAPDSHLLTGVIFGAFGQAVVRVHLDRLPGEAAEALTPLSIVGDWLAGVLDVQVPRAVRRNLRRLPAPELAQYVDHLFRLRVVEDVDVDKRALMVFARRVDASLRDILSGDPAEKLQARSSLMALGEPWVLKYRFDRPLQA